MDERIMDRSGFYNYKGKLINFFEVTRKFYENLLEGIEKGLTN
jgi:hypothetical protein